MKDKKMEMGEVETQEDREECEIVTLTESK